MKMIFDKIRYSALPVFWLMLIIFTLRGLGQHFLLVCGCSAILYIVLKSNGKLTMYKTGYYSFMLYYLFVTICSIALYDNTFGNLIGLIVKYILFPVAMVSLAPRDICQIKKQLNLFKMIMLGCALLGIIEFIIKYNPLVDFVVIEGGKWINAMNGSANYQPSSIFLHYNYYGCVLVMAWILALCVPFANKNIEIINKCAILGAILLCRSRIAWIAAFVVSIVFFINNIKLKLSKNTMMRIIAGLFVSIIMIIIFNKVFIDIWNIIYDRFARIFNLGFSDGSFGQRVGTLLNYFAYVQDNGIKAFLGSGYGTILQLFLKEYSFYSGYNTADSQITVYLVEIGVIGVLLYVYMCYNLIKYSKQKDSSLGLLARMFLYACLVEMITLDFAANNFVFFFLFYSMILIVKSLNVQGGEDYESI